VKETLELTVAELDCADEAQQIQSALGRLHGVSDVRTAVSSPKAIVAYDPGTIGPDPIREAIRSLGMTVGRPGDPPARCRQARAAGSGEIAQPPAPPVRHCDRAQREVAGSGIG